MQSTATQKVQEIGMHHNIHGHAAESEPRSDQPGGAGGVGTCMRLHMMVHRASDSSEIATTPGGAFHACSRASHFWRTLLSLYVAKNKYLHHPNDALPYVCMRSKAWLAARDGVRSRASPSPGAAARTRRSRRLCATLAAVLVLSRSILSQQLKTSSFIIDDQPY